MDFSGSIENIKGVGLKTKERLNKLGIYTIMDILMYFPKDYEEMRSDIQKLEEAIEKKVILKCKVLKINSDLKVKTKAGRYITISTINFEFQNENIIGKWFNFPFVKESFSVNETYNILGVVKKVGNKFEIVTPVIVKEEVLDSKIIPKYALTKNMSGSIIGKIISNILLEREIKEHIDSKILKEKDMLSLNDAINNIHFPRNSKMLGMAKKRLIYEEFLIHSLKLEILREERKKQMGIPLKIAKEMIEFKESIPFSLTNTQSQVIREILHDQKKDEPMNRIVQGDVGSGKTIVALISLFNTIKNGYQGAMMAPTEILARQHYIEAKKIYENFNINVELLVGSTTAKEKKRIKEETQNGNINLLIGTHALIEEDVVFNKLGLVVTDEQHRFGVNQRKRLINKGDTTDVLIMTATPIPRTLSLCVYGDLDISVINEMPKGRKKIQTKVYKSESKSKAYEFARKEISKGRQIYVVCPLVFLNDKLERNSVEEVYEDIRKTHFKDNAVEILHGKMKAKEKNEIMQNFKDGKIDVIVSTTVIEVGVNVPNASVMIIENAECFGLSQLHQLRGRVGRGEYESFAFLVSESKSSYAKKKLKVMEESGDGFFIAKKDMELRGSGNIFGLNQSGDDDFMLADIYRDFELFKIAKDDARELLNSKGSSIVKEVKNNLEYTLMDICMN